jgi:metalloendopeptidase OMA1, mitochondrial
LKHILIRRFHGEEESDYLLPNDEEEHQRLEYLQLVCRTAAGGNILAPISSQPSVILDVGTGGGAWCLEVAKEYPTTSVFGLDISPVIRSDKPPNCDFIVGNLRRGLPFADNSVDFVHSRFAHSFSRVMSEQLWPQ